MWGLWGLGLWVFFGWPVLGWSDLLAKIDNIQKLVNSYGHGHDYQTRCAKPAICVLPILLVTVHGFFV